MFAAVSGHNPNKDYEVSQPPEDSISKVGELYNHAYFGVLCFYR